MKGIVKLVTLIIVIITTVGLISGCTQLGKHADESDEVVSTGETSNEVDANQIAEGMVNETETEDKEESIEEVEEQIDLPDLYNEEAYFEALEMYYERMNEYDIDGIIDMTYYVEDEREEEEAHDRKVYERNLEVLAYYFVPKGMKTFIEVSEVDEGDGQMSYRAKIIFVKEERYRDENGEFKIYEFNGNYYSNEQISTATVVYDIEEQRWKVWSVGDMATFRVHGYNHTDWMTYLFASEDHGGWIGDYGKWYNKMDPPYEGWYEENFPNEVE